MSQPGTPSPGILTVSLLYHVDIELKDIAAQLEGSFGQTDAQLSPFPFTFTNYYQPEMGEPLFRSIIAFRELQPRQRLVSAKLATNELESEWQTGGKRSVNLDPGLITRENFLLATCKNFSHRIYLDNGIFADLTLIFQQGQFCSLPWTYADYQVESVRHWLAEQRRRLLDNCR
jgi:hypothetical protein